MADYQDFDYWRKRGVVPERDMFDTNTGKLKEGWRRSGLGYEYDYPNGTEDIPEPTGPREFNFGGGDDPSFDFPEWTPPQFSYADFPGFDKFVMPTKEQIGAEPGYAFARDEGQRAAENSAAARGTLRTGGTIKDLIAWGDKFADQNASHVIDRAFQTWGAENQNKFQSWEGNRQNALSTFDRNYTGSRDAFQFNKFEPAKLKFADMYNRFKAKGDWLSQIASSAPD